MAETLVKLVDDTGNTGKQVRAVTNNIAGQNVIQQVFTLANSDGTFLEGAGAGLPVSGDVASGTADSGNPVKMGAVYHQALPAYAAGQRGSLEIDEAGTLKVGHLQPGTPTYASATVANVANNQTLAAVASKFTYLAGFAITGLGATAAGVIDVTVTGVGATLHFALAIPAGATAGVQPLIVPFNPPLRSSAINTAIVVNVPAFGAGNTVATATAWGFVV